MQTGQEKMTGKYRRMKNPGEIDAWLETMGYYRKNVAYDETCLFRAISEQLYCSQMMHEVVRRECVEYARKYPYEFEYLLGSKKCLREHLNLLAVHMVPCGNTEIQLISKTYKREIMIFDGINFEIRNATKNNYIDIFQICLVNKDHYDVIYKRDYIVTAGFCQSIVYGILYENVFGVDNVSDIVTNMLYGKSSQLTIDEFNEKVSLIEESVEELKTPTSPFGGATGIAPFPYKVAKALDPNIYRNIAYDTWTEMRREMRLGEWYQGDDKLILGTCCEFKTENNFVHRCYIQEFLKGNEECVVYVPSLAERRIVKYKELSPEANAKPWPLPYRFSKNSAPTLLSPSPQPFTLQMDRKNIRRNRDIKKSCKLENISEADSAEREINAFEGCPLQMQTAQDAANKQERPVIMATTPTPPAPTHLGKQHVFSPETNLPSPFAYGYTSSPFSFGMYPTTDYMTAETPPLPPSMDQAQPAPPPQEPPPPATYCSPYVDTERHAVNMGAAASTVPQLEVYSVYPMPGTPIIYSPPEAPEIIVPPPAPPTHVPVYTPSVDMQYMPASPFIFPPTPPPWYPPGVNSQGFIFPTPYNGVNRF